MTLGSLGEIVAVGIDVIGLVNGVRLVQLHAVPIDLLVDDADAVAGHADARASRRSG